MKPVLVLDFDGVICDSIAECALSAFTAYDNDRGGAAAVDVESGLAHYPREQLERFRANRHLIRPAGDYWALVHWIRTRSGRLTPEAFRRLRAENEDRVTQFEGEFFAARERMRQADLRGWLDLHSQYPEFQEVWQELQQRWSVHVLSTKDHRSLALLNEHWGLGVSEHRLVSVAGGGSKARALREIAAEEGVTGPEVVYVDDHPEHLADVTATGAVRCWASWGYTPGTEVPGDRIDYTLRHLSDLPEPVMREETKA